MGRIGDSADSLTVFGSSRRAMKPSVVRDSWQASAKHEMEEMGAAAKVMGVPQSRRLSSRAGECCRGGHDRIGILSKRNHSSCAFRNTSDEHTGSFSCPLMGAA